MVSACIAPNYMSLDTSTARTATRPQTPKNARCFNGGMTALLRNGLGPCHPNGTTDQKTYAATAGLPCPTCSVRGDKESQHPRFHHPCESANVCKHTCSPRRVPHGSTFGGLQRVCASGDVQNQIAGYTSDVVKGLGIKRYASHLHKGHTSI